jgi:choline dehydrogenase
MVKPSEKRRGDRVPGSTGARSSGQTEFVVVGAGTAGCVIASRLSENPDNRVLLLEAGPFDGPAAMAVPAAAASLWGTAVDWAFRSEPQAGLNGAVVSYTRGRVLGGSSSINAMAHIRAHRSSYDDWVRDGARGWGYDDLLPYFRRSEHADSTDTANRGVDGPMQVAALHEVSPFALATRDAVRQAGLPFVDDINVAEQDGAGWLEKNVVDGVRQSAADAYIRPILADRPNLTVVTDALVHRLLFSGEHCHGAEYSVEGERHRVDATREVVLTAGAIGSPHLLMLSGIGRAADLNAHGVPVVTDLPGVGENLQDHPIARLVYSATGPVRPSARLYGSITALLRSDPAIEYPDIQLLFWDMVSYRALAGGPEHGYTIGVVAARPRSRGRIRLASGEVGVAPLIDPGFLTDADDVRVLTAGIRRAREIGEQPALAEWRAKEFGPGVDVQEADQLERYIREDTHSACHPAGTCRIGDDERAVVDSDLRVRGVTGLRVADASVMPSVAGANINATVLAIAERAAVLIGSRS